VAGLGRLGDLSGTEVTVYWRNRPIRAWVPRPLAGRTLDLSSSTIRRTEQAAGAVRRASEHLPPRWKPLARLLLRAEGIASSRIEELRAPLAEVAAAELDAELDTTAAWIADNLAVVAQAISSAHSESLSVELLHSWHTRLMRHGALPEEMVGVFRSVQGWVGGTTPTTAAFVPPPPELIPALVDDLVAFSNQTDTDPVTQSAVAHAQFETIHPYGDGNGRIGRVLVSWILARRLAVSVPPPVSVFIAQERGPYLSGLYRFRTGGLDEWVGWFADIVVRSGDGSASLVDRVQGLLVEWEQRLSDVRADAAARRLVAILPEHPVVSASLVAGAVGVSERAGRDALEALREREIVVPSDVGLRRAGRPRNWWVARELVDLVTTWTQ